MLVRGEGEELVPKASCWLATSGTERLTLLEKHVTIKSSENIKIVQWGFFGGDSWTLNAFLVTTKLPATAIITALIAFPCTVQARVSL